MGRGAHDICISEQTGKAYITAETDNVVTVVDTKTLARRSITVGPLPHHLEPSNDGHTIYVSLASHTPAMGAAQYAAIDTSDDSVTYLTSSDDAAARSHAISPTLDGDRLYIAHDTGNQVTAIDTATGSVDFTIPGISKAEESIPSRFGDLLWVAARGDNTVKRIDLASHTVSGSVAIGVQPESMMLTPNELTLVVSLRGSPASLGFVDTLTLTSLGLLQIGPEGSAGDLAVMTMNGHYVFATYDNGTAGTGGIAVVDVALSDGRRQVGLPRNRPAARGLVLEKAGAVLRRRTARRRGRRMRTRSPVPGRKAVGHLPKCRFAKARPDPDFR